MQWRFFFGMMLISLQVNAQTSFSVGVPTNIRALAVVDSVHWWFGGSGGWLGRTADGGRSWQLRQPAGPGVDFRSLHAFNAREAVAAIAGQPAQIYRTDNGGLSWKMVHQVNDSTAFIDALGFWNGQEGLLFGDPLPDGRLLLLRTADGGRTWQALPDSSRPLFYPGEAAFAASGTTMQCVGDSTVAIVSGGSRSRLWLSHNRGRTWEVVAADRWQVAEQDYARKAQQEFALMQHGQASKGTFTLGWSPHGDWVLAGGDYLQESLSEGHYLMRTHERWWRAQQAPRGYRECIAFVNADCWVLTGPGGSDVSWNAGLDWVPLNDFSGMHVARSIGNGVLLAGKGGQMWHYEAIKSPPGPDSVAVVTLPALKKAIAQEIHQRRKPRLMPEMYRSFQHNAAELDSLIPLLPGVISWTLLPECEFFIGCGLLLSWEYSLTVQTSTGPENVFVMISEIIHYRKLPFMPKNRFKRELNLRTFETSPLIERGWKKKCDMIKQSGWELAN